MTKKKIDTLVNDIYSLLDNGTTSPSQEYLFAMASDIVDSLKKQLWVGTRPSGKGKLRMSNIGKPCTRSLWYDINGDDNSDKLTSETKLKFIVGDVVEAVILYLVKESGHVVTDQQKEIEIDGIKGHIDAVIDGELVDVKSSSSYGMRKFKEGTLPQDDPFGYCSQISGYANALGKKSGTFLAFDKSAGDLALYTYKDIEDSTKRIEKVIADTTCAAPPERAFNTVEERATKKQKLGINCSYCSHKKTCWKDVGLDLKFKSGRPVFYVPTAGEKSNEHGF
jgi:hypothetical protein|tara:strand:+ start:3386 stop:4225 length:840 start_codon:yes stop_codon:yes gene_type:complete